MFGVYGVRRSGHDVDQGHTVEYAGLVDGWCGTLCVGMIVTWSEPWAMGPGPWTHISLLRKRNVYRHKYVQRGRD